MTSATLAEKADSAVAKYYIRAVDKNGKPNKKIDPFGPYSVLKRAEYMKNVYEIMTDLNLEVIKL